MVLLMSYREQCELMNEWIPILCLSTVGLVGIVILFQSPEKRKKSLRILTQMTIVFIVSHFLLSIGRKIFGNDES
jgi:CHASE2 domain-containing sensor protein